MKNLSLHGILEMSRLLIDVVNEIIGGAKMRMLL